MSIVSRQQAKAGRFDPNWPHYAAAALLGAVVLGNLLRWAILDWSDPYRCEALLTSGTWLDPGTWSNWQPQGCIHTSPSPSLLSQCLLSPQDSSTTTFPPLFTTYPSRSTLPTRQTATVRFIGDSTVRQLYFAASQIMDPSLPGTPAEAGGEKHSDRQVVVDGKDGGQVVFSFWWDPFLNTTQTTDYLARADSDPTALLVLGSGLWYLRHPSSGGIGAWMTMVDKTISSILDAQPKTSSHLLPPPILKPGQPGIAESIIFLPVTQPVDGRLSSDRAETISHVDVEAMNSGLTARLLTSHTSGLTPSVQTTAPIVIPSVFNQLLVPEETEDGLHYSTEMVRKQAEILLGYRCNNAAETQSGNCCRRERRTTLVQILVLAFVCGWGPMSFILRSKSLFTSSSRYSRLLAPESVALPLTVFGAAILYLFLADRTSVFMKEQKQYNVWTFTALIMASLVAGLISTHKKDDADLGFLNREQTDEWKGWMQIAILIYHILGASKVSGIYNSIRVLVASYLFMTGYGHFTYYYKKKEYGFQRIAMVMVRLNLLSVVLPYTMNTDYAFYYFAPLVSWWYTIIFFTMLIGHQYNDKPAFLVPKMIISAGLVTAFMKQEWIMKSIFTVLRAVFGIQWSATEWSFRVSLDLYIVYGGMFCAYAYIKIKEYRLPDKPWFAAARNALVGVSVLAFMWYFWFELSLPSKYVYNKYHAIVSFVPILSFIVLRNASVIMRSASSRVFIFIGQCSLETFILQFHGWMASDTKGILLVIPGTAWRPVNLVLSTIVFIWLSFKVSNATSDITQWAVGAPRKPRGPAANIPLPATTPIRPETSVVSAAATMATETIEPRDQAEGVPESIPLMNRDEPNEDIGVDGEGLVEANGKTHSSPANPSSSGASRILDKLATYSQAANTSDPAFKLGLTLVALWILNLLY